MFSYRLEETRLRQYRSKTSAANAKSVFFNTDAVPEGKVWIIHAAAYYPSAAETQVVSAQKVITGVGAMAILNPVSLSLDSVATNSHATFIEQGMEYFLFPGEYIQWSRQAATAGSTMTAIIQFTEIDLPLYTYDEPQTVKRQERAMSSIRTQLGGGLGVLGSRGRISSGEGGSRRGGPLEK